MVQSENDWFEALPGAVIVVARDATIRFANAHAERLFGYSEGGLTDLSLPQLVPERLRERLADQLTLFFAGTGTRPTDAGQVFEALRRDGSEIIVEVGFGLTQDGDTAVAIARDVTSPERTRLELSRGEQRYRSLVENSSESIWCFELEEPVALDLPDSQQLEMCYRYARLIEVNDFMACAYETRREEMIGWGLEAILPRSLPTSEPLVLEIIRSGFNVKDFETIERTPDGLDKIFLNSFTGSIENGRVVRVWGTSRDVTDLRRTEIQLRLRQAELEKLKNRLVAESDYLQEEIRSDHNYEEIVGRSPLLRATLELASQVATTDSTVLLLGETGVGKELLARRIHALSQRRGRALIKVDCSTLPAGLVESELFGHEKGAFTGAHASKAGRFEVADKGTIFLDEIGELPLDLQPKLLRVLESGEMQRVGSTKMRQVDVRLIAATNRDLKIEMEEARFRADLYYRLNVFPVRLSPLRERREDIPLLASFLLSRLAPAMGKKIDAIDRSSMDALITYEWPGNVRELQNVIERSVILCRGPTLEIREGLGEHAAQTESSTSSLRRDLDSVERSRILTALDVSDWKIKGEANAASRLGLKPSTLRSRMKRLGIERP